MKGNRIYLEAIDIHNRMYGLNGTNKDANSKNIYSEYFRLLRRAAYLGHIDAQYDYAQQFESMNFISLKNPIYNPKRAFYWYKKAAFGGHASANNNLAHMYETGEGCKKSIKKALLHYKEGARLGDIHSSRNLKILLRQLQKR